MSEPPQSETGFAGQLGKLVLPGSKPLASALRLPRDLQTSFSKTSDAGLRVTTAAAPQVRRAAVTALASDSHAAPPTELEVYALRLKTGLYGRTFPKQTLTQNVIERREPQGHDSAQDTIETITRSTVTDEWEVTVGAEAWNSEQPGALHLDGSYAGILPGQWLVLDFSAIPTDSSAPDFKLPGAPLMITQVQRVAAKLARAEYGASADSTRLELPAGVHWIEAVDSSEGDAVESTNTRNFRIVRRTAVYAQSERLALAELPIEQDVCQSDETSGYIELDALYADLEPGRFVLVQGERSDIEGVRGVIAAEALMLSEVVHDVRAAESPVPNSSLPQYEGPPAPLAGDRNHTFLRTDKPLSYCYYRDSVRIFANVVRATQGETRREILGSGDGTKPFQSFRLKQAPLTYVAAATAQGADSTLQVFVNDMRWHEVESLRDAAASEHAFVSRTDDAAQTQITFGNGQQGARLPTGAGNVTAVYRSGLGQGGNARAAQISTLGSRPLGVREVVNPLPATGGADRESRDQARKLVPIATRALDRLVSVQDYADFSQTFAGIAKADARELSDGARSVVHVSIAGADDIPIDSSSDLFLNLLRALRELGDPGQPIVLAARELLLLCASINLRIHPDYVWDTVVSAVRARLLERFGFEQRELAQRSYASELISAVQAVPGVLYVDLDAFGTIRTAELDPLSGELRPRTPAEIAEDVPDITAQPAAEYVDAQPVRRVGDQLLPAQLAMFSSSVPDTLVLNQIA